MRSHIDHHTPGDPGYGRPPAEFLPASSIGQVIDELARLGRVPRTWPVHDETVPGGHPVGPAPVWFVRRQAAWCVRQDEADAPHGARVRRVPHDLVLCAAADHCLAAAYRGECPGVDPDALMRWRAESRAAFQGRPVEAVLTDIEDSRDALRTAPRIRLDGWSTCPLHGERSPGVPDTECCPGWAMRLMGHATEAMSEHYRHPQLAAELADLASSATAIARALENPRKNA